MGRRITWAEAQRRLDEFNMTLVQFHGVAKPCVVKCNGCGIVIEFNTFQNATTKPNKYGGNGGCGICHSNSLSSLESRLRQCEYVYNELLKENEEDILAEAKTFEEMKLAIYRVEKRRKSMRKLENKMEAIKNRIAQLEE